MRQQIKVLRIGKRMMSTESSTIQQIRSQQNIHQRADRISTFQDSIWTEVCFLNYFTYFKIHQYN